MSESSVERYACSHDCWSTPADWAGVTVWLHAAKSWELMAAK